MRWRVVLTLLLVFALAVVPVAGAAMLEGDRTHGSTPTVQESQFVLSQEQPDPDNTITRIILEADGTATWQVTSRTRLATDADVAEYERFQDAFRANTSRYLDPFETRMTGVVDRTDERHDRSMRATEFSARTSIQETPRRWGVVTFEFTWEGFAMTDGDRVVVGDIFDGGFYIGEDDVLEIRAPEGFAVTTVEPTPDETGDRVLKWQGREDFPAGQPSVTVEPTNGDETTTPDSPSETSSGDPDRTASFWWLLLGFGVVIVLGTAYAYRTGRLPPNADSSDATTDAPSSPAASERTLEYTDKALTDDVESLDASEPTAADTVSVAADGDETDISGASGERMSTATGPKGISTATDTPTDPDLLTDEDRVVHTLQASDGRMKQSTIVDELEWSKSKTSRVLSRMADEGTVEKLRIGRENVIDLREKP